MNFFDSYPRIASEAKSKRKQRIGLKVLSPKQMLQRLPITLVQVKAGNTSENLLNEIRQIVYSLYRKKEITKTVYNNKWIQHSYKTEWTKYLRILKIGKHLILRYYY